MGIKQELIEEIKYDDLPDNFKVVADACGLEVAKALIVELGGCRLDVPQTRSLKKTISRFIKSRREVPAWKIAQELHLTERFIRKLQE